MIKQDAERIHASFLGLVMQLLSNSGMDVGAFEDKVRQQGCVYVCMYVCLCVYVCVCVCVHQCFLEGYAFEDKVR